MIRNFVATTAATLLLLALTLTAAPAASAGMPALSGGMRITNADGSGCSIAFADPLDPWLIYTAAHCFDPGKSRVVSTGHYLVGKYRPDLVYDTKLDVVAIQLFAGVKSEYEQCDGAYCHPIGVPRTAQVGDYVCKYGSISLQTCGPVTGVYDNLFAMDLPAVPGDSGGPIYQIDADGTAHLVGVMKAIGRADPGTAYGTKITRIADLLKRTWGPNWRMA